MGGEPWTFTPDQIARLTDWQIDEVYLKPAIEKMRMTEAERKGLPYHPPGDADQPMTTPPNRQMMIDTAVSYLGKSREQAAAEYDSQLAEWNAQKTTG